MILSRAPTRITLGGGGTDLKSYYAKHGVFLIAGAIDKYCTLLANRRFYDSIRLSYSQMEIRDIVADIEHRIFRVALELSGIEKGIDWRKWFYYPKRIIGYIGAINAANSLAAIKTLVFEQRKVSLPELLEAIGNNWEGEEGLRQMFINEAPKFGNDDDYIDLLAREVHCKATHEIEIVNNYYGHPFLVDGSVGSTYYAFSGLTGATPDGRKDRDLFADGTASPTPGTDKKGPTAILKSVSKLDPLASHNHLLNQKFLPQFLGEENKEIFAAYLKSWCDLGIHHIQFNVADRETLLDAQQHPEKHSDLVVRVAGYSAYFVDLSKKLQDEIIRRTEQGFR